MGRVPRVGPELSLGDRLNGCKVRWGWGRYDYTVVPGLYALGRPDADSPVLVTANYKLSFDALRRELKGQNLWLLPLDTNGINVWCAAGKRTFGTETLARAVRSCELAKLVKHRTLILPQLGAPGVAAHAVKRLTGFTVAWGPLRAADLPAFLAAGGRVRPAMRRVEFPLRQRAALAPMELMPALKYALPLAVLMVAGSWLLAADGRWGPGLFMAGALIWAALAGAVAGPLLLPWLPGRAFSAKGLGLGMLAAAIYLAVWPAAVLSAWAAFFLILAVCSFLVMNFTGSSTYTSLSGVRREMRRYLPWQALGAALALGLWFWALVA